MKNRTIKSALTTIALLLTTSLNAADISQDFTFFNERKNPNLSRQTLHYSIKHEDGLEKIVAHLKTKALEGSYIYEKRGDEILYTVKTGKKTNQYKLQEHDKPLVKIFEELGEKLEKYGIEGMPACIEYPQAMWVIEGDPSQPTKEYESIKACTKGNHKIGDTTYMLLQITQKKNKKLPVDYGISMLSLNMFVTEDAQIPWMHVELTFPITGFWDYTCFDQELEKKRVYNSDFANICSRETGVKIKPF